MLDLRATVTKGIAELRKEISQKSSELAALNKDLERHEMMLKMLSGDNRARSAMTKKAQPNRNTDWNGIFKRLPRTFTSRDFRKAAAGADKSAVYLRQVLSRWAKGRKIKRLERGTYRKA